MYFRAAEFGRSWIRFSAAVLRIKASIILSIIATYKIADVWCERAINPAWTSYYFLFLADIYLMMVVLRGAPEISYPS